MLHKSKLGEHAEGFPHDRDDHVPHLSDHWRHMNFDHGAKDPDEEGIDEAERARRIEYLDTVWWPEVLAKVDAEKQRLEQTVGHSFIERWQDEVQQPPLQQHGFQAGDPDIAE